MLNVLEYAKSSKYLKSVVLITSDKCYKNKELSSGYSEESKLEVMITVHLKLQLKFYFPHIINLFLKRKN